MNRINLGYIKNSGNTYLTKNKWDCDWYWSFGYIGNSNCHSHIEQYLTSEYFEVNKVFDKTWITQNQWYVLRDLFIQAYKIKSAAETYIHGGHQTSDARKYSILSEDMNVKLNKDLETLLDRIWDYIIEIKSDYDAKAKREEERILSLVGDE